MNDQRTLKGIAFSEDTYPLRFDHRNHRGETAYREARPIKIYFGSSERHPEKQWLMEAFDFAKGEVRIFAMRDMLDLFDNRVDFIRERAHQAERRGDTAAAWKLRRLADEAHTIRESER